MAGIDGIRLQLKNIEVKNGEVEIGFILNGRPDTWGSIDDIEFYVQK